MPYYETIFFGYIFCTAFQCMGFFHHSYESRKIHFLEMLIGEGRFRILGEGGARFRILGEGGKGAKFPAGTWRRNDVDAM